MRRWHRLTERTQGPVGDDRLAFRSFVRSFVRSSSTTRTDNAPQPTTQGVFQIDEKERSTVTADWMHASRRVARVDMHACGWTNAWMDVQSCGLIVCACWLAYWDLRQRDVAEVRDCLQGVQSPPEHKLGDKRVPVIVESQW